MIEKKISIVTEESVENLAQAPDSYFLEIKVLDALENSDRDDILDFVCSKLRKNGTLILQGIDFIELCRRGFYREIPNSDFSDIVKRSSRVNSLISLREYFENIGWDIEYAGLKDSRYFLEVKRNG